MKILLVDDSELMLRYVSDLLVAQGHLVTRARTIVEAVDAYAGNLPEALLMDFILEGNVTGLDALSAIFALPGKRPHAAILTQGELAPGDRQKAASMNLEVLQKPVRGSEAAFLAQINAWLTRG